MMNNSAKSIKKSYDIETFEVTNFDSLVSSYSPDLKDLAVYARIPLPTGDCNDTGQSGPIDFCMAIN